MFTFNRSICLAMTTFIAVMLMPGEVSAQTTGSQVTPVMRAEFNNDSSLLDQVMNGNGAQQNEYGSTGGPGQSSPLRGTVRENGVATQANYQQPVAPREPYSDYAVSSDYSVNQMRTPGVPDATQQASGQSGNGVVQDSNVAPVYFPESSPSPAVATPPVDAAPLAAANESGSVEQLNFIERELSQQSGEVSDTPAGKETMPQLISRIGLNLALVLTFASAFIIGARRFMKKMPVAGNHSTDGKKGTLEVRETLVLNNRTTLYLVQWRSNRVLVACDGEGIKSVQPLNSSFGQTLSELAGDEPDEPLPEPARRSRVTEPAMDSGQGVDDKIIRLLLQNASQGRNGTANR